MTTGLSVAWANQILNGIGRTTAITAATAIFAKLHTGDPGAAGTSNAFGDATRQAVGFAAAASGAMASSAAVTFPSLTAAGTISHVSYWDHATAGAFIGSDALNASQAVSVGDDALFASGVLTLNVTPLAA